MFPMRIIRPWRLFRDEEIDLGTDGSLINARTILNPALTLKAKPAAPEDNYLRRQSYQAYASRTYENRL